MTHPALCITSIPTPVLEATINNPDIDVALEPIAKLFTQITAGDCAAQMFSGFEWADATPQERHAQIAEWLRMEAMCLNWDLPHLETLAKEARCINDDDWGSDRQIAAQNLFFNSIQKAISTDAFEGLEAYCLKANVHEMVDEAMRLAKIALA